MLHLLFLISVNVFFITQMTQKNGTFLLVAIQLLISRTDILH